MTRLMLSAFVATIALATGLAAAWLQCDNHARADLLDRMKRRDDQTVAGNETLEARILSQLYTLEQTWVDESRVALEEVPER